MSYHDMRALHAGASLAPESLEAFLLNQCRCFAAGRTTGSALPLDHAFRALDGVLAPAEACAVFGALHRFVAALMAAEQPTLGWYPPSCHRASPDEMRVLALLAGVPIRQAGWPCDEVSALVDATLTPALLAALDMLGCALQGAGLLPEPASRETVGIAVEFGLHAAAGYAA